MRPLERVECDDTKLDLMVIDTETRLPLGRPWLTRMIDVWTKIESVRFRGITRWQSSFAAT